MRNGNMGLILAIGAAALVVAGTLAYSQMMDVVREEAKREVVRQVDKPLGVLEEKVESLDVKVDRIIGILDSQAYPRFDVRR